MKVVVFVVLRVPHVLHNSQYRHCLGSYEIILIRSARPVQAEAICVICLL